jgi:hypothetical protein
LKEMGTSETMRALALVATGLLGMGIAGCGSSATTSGAGKPASASQTSVVLAGNQSAPAPPGGYLKADEDTDSDEHNSGPSDDDTHVMPAGAHPAGNSDTRAIAAAVKRYFAAATAEQGTNGCSLLDQPLAQAIAGEHPGGGSCSASLAALFKAQHQHFLAENTNTMVVTGVFVSGAEGFVKLGFRTSPETEITVQREGGAWKIDALSDSILP